jgi:hypothetical protein
VGTGFGYIESLIDNFNTVFIVNDGDRSIRNKKVVYRDGYKDLVNLPDVDAIFFDHNLYANVPHLEGLLRKTRPVIFVQGQELFPKNEYRYLKSQGYAVTEKLETMHKWTPT